MMVHFIVFAFRCQQ